MKLDYACLKGTAFFMTQIYRKRKKNRHDVMPVWDLCSFWSRSYCFVCSSDGIFFGGKGVKADGFSFYNDVFCLF